MTKTKTIFAITFAAIFAVSIFGTAFATDSVALPWQTFDIESITVDTGKNISKLSLTADASST